MLLVLRALASLMSTVQVTVQPITLHGCCTVTCTVTCTVRLHGSCTVKCTVVSKHYQVLSETVQGPCINRAPIFPSTVHVSPFLRRETARGRQGVELPATRT